MTPPSAASADPVIQQQPPILPGQIPGANPPPNAPKGTAPGSAYSKGKPGAPGAGGNPAHPLFGKFGGTPKAGDPAQAAKLAEEGDKFYERKNWKKAFEAYSKSFAADPTQKKIILRLASIAFNQGDPIQAHDFITFYIDTHPEDVAKRKTRLQLNQVILEELQKNAAKFAESEKQQLQQIVIALVMETKLDQAVLMASDPKGQIEGLKKMEEQLKGLHGESKENKQKALASLGTLVEEMTQMAQMPTGNPKLDKLLQEELPKIISEAFGIMFRFAKEDKDESINKMAPLFEGYHYLAQGKLEDAVKPFETLRSEGFKTLGGGDEEKGRKKLEETYESVQKLIKENKIAEAQKAMAEIPSGLMDAYVLLEKVEGDHLRRANLAAVQAWKGKIQDDWHATFTDAQESGWGFPAALTAVFSKDPFDANNERAAAERDVAYEVERKLEKGEAKTIVQALEQIRDKGPVAMQARAKELLDTSGKDVLTPAFTYLSKAKPDPALEKTLLSSATTLKTFARVSRTSTALFTLIEFHSRDAAVKKEAAAGIEKDHQSSFMMDYLKIPAKTAAASPAPEPEPTKHAQK